MITTYPEFLAVCESKCKMYKTIPDRYLSIEGQQVYALYNAVEFNACFASDATELLEMLSEDETVANAAQFAGSELRKIRRCLERLAKTEQVKNA